MVPIRVGLVGLSTSSTQAQWASKAHLPYLLSAHGKERFELVALCNTSHASAHRSIDEYKLPASMKTYDSPVDLAADNEIDLIVNVTGVDKHHQILLPALDARKNVFTELPLASNMSEMSQLMDKLAAAKVNNVFGMQGQTSPVVKVLRDTIAQGKIGKILSSTWTGTATHFSGEPLPVGLSAFTDRSVGANLLTVAFLHSINYIMATLGEIETFQSILGNQRPSVDLVDPSQNGKHIRTVQKDTPDQILFQGRIDSGALLSYHLRGGNPFPGEKGLVWSIYGEKGEIRVTSPQCLLDIVHAGVEMKLQPLRKDQPMETLDLPKDELSEIPHPAQNVGRIYAAYAEGNKGGNDGYPDWEQGMKRHRLIEAMWKQADGQRPFGMIF